MGSEAVRVVVAGRVMVQSMVGRFDADDVRPSFDCFAELTERWPAPARLGTLTVSPGVTVAPDGRAVAAVAAWKKDVAPRVAASALVLLADGFVASAARAVLGGVAHVSRSPFPERVFSSVGEALPWLGGHARLSDEELRAVERAAHVLGAAHGYEVR